jgi:hypothetical protein
MTKIANQQLQSGKTFVLQHFEYKLLFRIFNDDTYATKFKIKFSLL